MAAPRRPPRAWPLAAVSAYALLVPFQPVFTMPDGSPLRFAASDAVAPLVFLAALTRPRRRLPAGLAAIVLAVPVLALFSTLWAAEERSITNYALGKTAGLFYLAGLALAVGRALARGAEPTVLRALARGSFWSAAIGLAAYAASFVGFRTTLVEYDRLCGTMPGDPNIYCSLLAVSLLVVVADHRLGPWRRATWLAVIALALVATGSRSGLLAVAAGGLVYGLARTRDRWVATARVLYVAAALAVVGTPLILSEPGSAAVRGLWEHTWRTWTVESRLDLYARAAEQFIEHPLLGLGVGGFNDLNTWDHGGERGAHFPVHDTYLWAFVDLGIGGGLLVAGLVAAGIVRCLRAAARRAPPDGAAVVAAGIAAMAVFNLFVDGFYQRHFWVLIACALGMRAAPRRRPVLVRAQRSPAHPSLAYSELR